MFIRLNIKTFILLIVFIIIAWLVYSFFHKPDKTLIVRFKEAPPIVQGILRNKTSAYYRGIKVGEVSRIILSKDQQYVLFYLNIYYKNLRLPENINITLRIQDIFGGNYIELRYPENPSTKFLCDQNIVEGVAVIERIDNYMINQFESGQIKEVLTNLNIFLSDLRSVSDDPKTKKDIQNIFGKLSRVLDKVSLITEDKNLKNRLSKSLATIQSLNEKLPDINKNIHLTNLNVSKVDNTITKTEKTLMEVGNQVTSLNQDIPNISEEINRTSSVISLTNKDLTALNSKIPLIPSDLVEKADQTLNRTDCLSQELGNMLDKRFLIFRFMLGKPGRRFKECIPQKEQLPKGLPEKTLEENQSEMKSSSD